MDKTQLIEKVKNAGIIGAGGAGFPTAVKLNSAPEFVIVNGIECEPLIQVDQQLAALNAPVLLKTLDTLVETLGAKQGIFAIKEKYVKAHNALKSEISKYPRLTIKTLISAYPMGDEQVLVYETIGRIVPEAGIPLNVGAVVINTETLFNIGKALEDMPITEKFVSVVGAVKNPKTFKVPLGITMRSLIEEAGGATVENPILIDGGPMMGKIERNLDAPITKITKSIIVLEQNHPIIISKEQAIRQMLTLAKAACCHCMMCSLVCPRNLLGHSLYPDKLMRLAAYNSTCEKDIGAATAYLCCECRLCEYACIMQLQPWKLNKELKIRLKAADIKNPHKNAPSKVNTFREYSRYPTDKLVRQLGLSKYYHIDAPMSDWTKEISEVVLPTRQHFGAPAEPIAAVGAQIKKGEIIAKMPDGVLGADIHSSIDGIVKSVDKNNIVIQRG
ncbi:MAG: SLBB domain-containing protein [Elusimicrobiota bacterium]|nr:SLBB domain-containing protein [Elusimicrobiota bacterium]